MLNRRKNALSDLSRSGMAIRITIPILGMAGMGISGYLTYVHYQWIEPMCLAGMDCSSVLFSPYAQIWDIPISLLGFLMYAVLTVCGGIFVYRQKRYSPLIALGIYTLALSGTLYSIYLIYREFRMQAFCSWCLGSAILMASILVLSIINMSAGGRHIIEILNSKHVKQPKFSAMMVRKGES